MLLRACLALPVFALLPACSGAGEDTGTKRPPKDDRDSDTDVDDTGPVDEDGDGVSPPDDCDDTDANVLPGADDPCDGVDNDCDGEEDEDAEGTFQDADGDGFGDPSVPLACDGGGASNDRDCDDLDANAFPGSDEICNGADDDCDGGIDEDLLVVTSYPDSDRDGSGDLAAPKAECQIPEGFVENGWDCDDTDSASPAWVQTDGRRNAGGTMSDPYASIQEGIDAGRSCVMVGPGSYTESINFNGATTEVRSTDGAELTWIVANGTSAVTFENRESSRTVLDGFTISGSTGHTAYSDSENESEPYTYHYYYTYSYGGGIYISGASPTLLDLVISDCTLPVDSTYTYSSGYDIYYYIDYAYGGGMYVLSGTPTLVNVTFSDNQADVGGAVYLSSSGGIDGTRVQMLGNYATYGSAIAAGSYNTITLQNAILNANTSSYGLGAIYLGYQSSLTLDHGTLVSADTAIYADSPATVDISNSIIVGNNYGIYNRSTDGGSTYYLSYNNVYTNTYGNYYNLDDPTGTNGNIGVAPRFVVWVDDTDHVSDDLQLLSTSDCVDAGDPSDLDADGSGNDLGAYGGISGADW